MTPPLIPHIPESAPFTAEQRAYLNGFLAGLFSRVPVSLEGSSPPPTAKRLEPLAILFGSQTGNAETLSKRVSKEAGKHGFAPTIYEMSKPIAQLASERHVLVITSTYGDGEPPDNGKSFWEALDSSASPTTQALYSVCALGDTNYSKFCQFGKDVDARLEKLGAKRIHPRVDCDTDFESAFQQWLHAALVAMSPAVQPGSTSGAVEVPVADSAELHGSMSSSTNPVAPSRDHPSLAPCVANLRLNGPGSAKDTRHIAFSLGESGLNYEAGDALGVIPQNCPALVRDVIKAIGCHGEELVPGAKGQEVPLREALLCHYDITKISSPLLQAFSTNTGDEFLKSLLAPGINGELKKFMWGREVIDLLLAYPSVKFSASEFTVLLKKLQPRLYSISSSPKAHAGQVHLCVGVVRYDSLGRLRKGVCSTFLADRVPEKSTVPLFVQKNKNFRPPLDGETPMIMVGPGTGIAPFRSFLHEREAAGAKGKTWLFFGDQRASTDFLYREELTEMQRTGALNRLDLAFSRDQEEKVYVQNRMQENANELFAWLEQGACFYVCGDANRMAKDVDTALHQVIQKAGGRTADQAAEYVQGLRKANRYSRDVY